MKDPVRFDDICALFKAAIEKYKLIEDRDTDHSARVQQTDFVRAIVKIEVGQCVSYRESRNLNADILLRLSACNN